MSSNTGASFPGYRDAVLIGEGGLGRVYRAVRISTGGPVAIKEVRDVQADSPAWRNARRELDAMLRVKGHAYVVNVEEIIETERGPSIVMEFVSGGSLHDRFITGRLSPGELVLVGSQVSQALAAAHAAGVVHRDLKPHNLLVGQFGQVKVCDFGIAALHRDGHRTVLRANTPAFASPEEIAGADDVGPPADVFSLAATMAHLAMGGPTYRGGRVDCGRELHELGVRSPELRSLVEVLQRALRPHPEARPTMAALVEEFDDASVLLGRARVRSLVPLWSSPGSGFGETGDADPTVIRGASQRVAIAAGWYADPGRRHELRFWDGEQWTEHVSTGGASTVERAVTGGLAGWYLDPSGKFDQRYFDGTSFTANVMKHGLTGVDNGGRDVAARAGWHTDPSGRYAHRYWDGTAWSSKVSKDGVAVDDVDTLGKPLAGYYSDPTGRHQRRYYDGEQWTNGVWTADGLFHEADADWYTDPRGRFELRYWDGAGWTAHVSRHGVVSLDPL